MDLKKNTTLHGFLIDAAEEIPEYQTLLVQCTHTETNLKLCHMCSRDKENLFAFIFKTPPYNEAGLPHMTEHMVLCGSRHYPSCETFAQLLHSGLSTYLNAWTFADKTIYPAGSQLEKDFYNLLLVYGDLVFFPLLSAHSFSRECFHIIPGENKASGVVFNEILGNFFNPDTIISKACLTSLFPDTPYKYDAGGKPAAMLTARHEDVIKFYNRYYHPSNCRIFLYGNIPTEKHLEFLQIHFLKHFTFKKITAGIPLQPRWRVPKFYEIACPAREEVKPDIHSGFYVNWLLDSVTDPFHVLCMEIISEFLSGNPGAPLVKSLSDAGATLSPITGLETEAREIIYSIGVMGADRLCREQVKTIVFDTLKKIISNGVPVENLKAAIARVEFRNRELKRIHGPYSLFFMRKILRAWLHDEQPAVTLVFQRWLEHFKALAAGDKDFVPGLLEKYLYANSHRSLILARPDPGYRKKAEQELLSRVRGLTQAVSLPLSGSSAPCVIPCLTREDIPRKVDDFPMETTRLAGTIPLCTHDIFTNNIVYIDLLFDLEGVPADWYPFLPVWGKCLIESGIPGCTYDKLMEKTAELTGGFHYSSMAGRSLDSPRKLKSFCQFSFRVLESGLSEAINWVIRILNQALFDDKQRLKAIILEMKNDLQSYFYSNAQQFIYKRIKSRLSPTYVIDDIWTGIAQLQFLKNLASDPDFQLGTLAPLFRSIRDTLINQHRLSINATASGKQYANLEKDLPAFASAFGSTAVAGQDCAQFFPCASVSREIILTQANSGFTGRAFPAALFGTKEEAAQCAAARLLNSGCLWQEIRTKGGAYGIAANADGMEEIFSFISFYDPDIARTGRVFKKALQSIVKHSVNAADLTRAVIGTVGSESKPLSPYTRGLAGLKQHLFRIPDYIKQKRREYMLDLNAKDISLAAQALLDSFDRSFEIIMTDEKKLQADNEGSPHITRI